MLLRTIVTPENHSFFLFGARGTGKRHLLRQRFPKAGRAFVRNLFPLTFSELKESFDQFTVLAYGSLPKISIYSNTADRVNFLQAYCQVYLREEIWNEQIIRFCFRAINRRNDSIAF